MKFWKHCAALTTLVLCACGETGHGATARTSALGQFTQAPNGVRCTNSIHGATYLSCEERVSGRPGVRCSGAFGPGIANPSRVPPPVSYAFSEIGQQGVPTFDASTSALLRRIAHDINSKTLRFAYPLADPQRLVVYDATRGPCDTNAYQVLNLAGIHNAMYRPGDDPNHIMAYPVDWNPTPFPWMNP